MSYGGFGQPGPRTTERKDWLSEIKKGVLLTIVIWMALCLAWLLLSAILWLVAPDCGLVRWFEDRPRVWGAVNLGLGLPCLFGLIVWARQELLDADWTSLQGRHELSGIMPMTPIIRLIMFWQWMRDNRTPRVSAQDAEIELRARLNRSDDDEPTK